MPQNVSYSPKYTVKKWGWLNLKNVISVATHLAERPAYQIGARLRTRVQYDLRPQSSQT